MDEMMGAIGLGKSEGWAGCPGWAEWAEATTWHRATPLLTNAHALLEVCGVGPDHHLPSSSQQCPRETQRSRSSTPTVAQTGFPSTTTTRLPPAPACFPLHR